MVSVLNFKSFDRGSIRGFFDLRYHGLTIKGCRLMAGNDGLWFSFPQQKGEESGETKYYDQMFLTALEREHVRRLILLEIQRQGHLPVQEWGPKPTPRSQTADPHRTPEGENLAEHYTQPGGDGIPF